MPTTFQLVDRDVRLRAPLAALVAGLVLSSCGGGADCGGPFCVPPERAFATKVRPGVGDGQTGAPGRQLDDSIEVIVTDDEDRPVPDVIVSFTVGQGGGSVSEGTVQSDNQGQARVSWTLGPQPGVQTIQASASEASGLPLDGSPVTFSAQAVRPGAARIVFQQAPPATVRNGIPFDQQPVLQVLDADDQPVPEAQVVASIASGGGALNGTTTVQSDGSGLAAFSDLAIVGTKGPRTLRFSLAEPSVEVVSGTVEVGAGNPTDMSGNPPLTYESTVSSPVSPSPSVTVKDAAGNGVPGVVVTFTINRDATVSPETATTNDEGIAQVASWTLGSTANVLYSLTARVEGSALPPVQFTSMARSGAAGRLLIATQPSGSAQSGTPFAVQAVIQVADRNGNPAPQANVRVEATVSSGPAGTLQNASATTDATGKATFSGLTLSGLVGNYTVSFSAEGLTGATSVPISLTAGPAARVGLVTMPSSVARSRAPLATQPSVQLQDASGNPIAQSGVQVVASITAGGGTLGGAATVTTGNDGRATFADMAIASSPGQKILSFTSPGLESASAQVTLPSVASIAVQTGPPASAPAGSQVTNAPSWMLRDAQGQSVADAPVVLNASSGGSLVPISSTSDGNGIVQVQIWTLGTTVGDQFVEVLVPGGPSNQVHLQVTAGPAAQLLQISGDGQSAPVNSNLPELLFVRVVDQYGNGVGAVTVEWRGCDGSGDYNPQTDSEGYSSALQPTGSQTGEFCTTASVSGVGGSPVTFNYTVTAAASPASQSQSSIRALTEPGAPAPVAPSQPAPARRSPR